MSSTAYVLNAPPAARRPDPTGVFTSLAPFRLKPNATVKELFQAATARSNPFSTPAKTGEATLLRRSSVRDAPDSARRALDRAPHYGLVGDTCLARRWS